MTDTLNPMRPSQLDPEQLQPIYDIIDMFTDMYGENYINKLEVALSGKNLHNALTGKIVLFDLVLKHGFVTGNNYQGQTMKDIPADSFAQMLSLVLAQPNKFTNNQVTGPVMQSLAKLVTDTFTE